MSSRGHEIGKYQPSFSLLLLSSDVVVDSRMLSILVCIEVFVPIKNFIVIIGLLFLCHYLDCNGHFIFKEVIVAMDKS
jgi:hypothetical protein